MKNVLFILISNFIRCSIFYLVVLLNEKEKILDGFEAIEFRKLYHRNHLNSTLKLETMHVRKNKIIQVKNMNLLLREAQQFLIY